MVRHLIYIYKVPESNRRISFVHSSNQPIYHEDLPKLLVELTEKFELTIHRFMTDDFSTDSIVKKDAFFDCIEFLSDLDAFSHTLEETISNQSVTPLQFSELLLSKYPLNKHQIQTVLYLIYAECLMVGIKLFDTPPVAFEFGPVFEDVYSEFETQSNHVPIEVDISVQKLGTLPKTVYRPKVREITKWVIDAFKDKDSRSLIDITLASGGPWYKVYERGTNNIIDDDTIIEYNDKVLSELYG